MTHKILIAFLCLITTLGLAACKPKVSEENKSRFQVAGIDNGQDVAVFLEDLKQAVANDDRKKVASMIRYPFATYDLGEKVKDYPAPEDVIADYDQLFKPQVKEAVANATMDNLFANQQGGMIGQGQIWFTPHDGKIKINAVQTIN